MKKILLLTTLLTAIFGFGQAAIFAQNGGKAEPNEIKFKKGAKSATVTGNVKGSEEAEYIFSAKRSQKVSLKVASNKPKGNFHRFMLKGSDVEFTTKQNYYRTYDFIAPETGSYFVSVTFDSKGNTKTGTYALTLAIKN